MFHLLLLGLLTAIVGSQGHNFTNPLVEHGADPWMVYYKGFYYLLVTPWTNEISMRKSATLEGLATAENQQIYSFDGHDCWAPEVHQVEGKWYLYYTACLANETNASCHRNHVAESAGDDPLGPYTFKRTLIDEEDNFVAEIDPSIIRINGTLYLLGSIIGSTQDLYIRTLTDPYTAVGKKTIIAKPTFDWEKSGWTVNEGPEALFNGDRVFVIFSASLCSTPDYKLGVLEFVGTDPMNADHWRKHPTPVLVRDDARGVYGPGHNGFFKSPDGTENWIIYHANSDINGKCDGNRNPRAKKFTFGADGLPIFGEPDAAGVVLEGPAGEP